MKLYLKNKKTEGIFDRRILAIGAGETGRRFVKEIKDYTSFFFLVGFLDEDKNKVGSEIDGIEILGTADDLSRIIREYRIEEIFITIESVTYDKILTLIEIAKDTKCQVNLVSSHFGVVEKKVDVIEYKDLKSVPVYSTMTPIYSKFVKKIVDVLIAFLAIIILFPLLILISILIKLTSKGSIFYKTKVIGKNGKDFIWFKFRTMVEDRDEKIHKEYLKELITENKPVEKIKDDPRITSIGKTLRKYSLDEFPQLLNVLRGDMSLIGPRPCLPYEYEYMDDWHRRRTKVIPGLTGLWQVFGRNKPDVSFNDSLILDIYYAENLSFWLDMRIFFKTVPIVIFGKGGS
jgi:undecaprenyl-phosphate galactose phosphotransferase